MNSNMASSFDEDFGKWLKRMGYNKRFSEEQLNTLAPYSIKTLWRHIILHVRPSEDVKILRQNLLLNKLNATKTIKLNMALSSVKDFENYNIMKNKEKILEDLKKDEANLENSIQKLASAQRQKKFLLEHKKEKLSEKNMKAKMFNMKQKLISYEMNKLPEIYDIFKNLHITHGGISQEQYKENKTNFACCITLVREYVEMKRLKQLSEEQLKTRYEEIIDFISEKLHSLSSAGIYNNFINLMELSRDDLSLMNFPDVETVDCKIFESDLEELWKSHYNLILEEKNLKESLYRNIKDLEDLEKVLINQVKINLDIRENDVNNIQIISGFISNTTKFTSLEEVFSALKESNSIMHEGNRKNSESDLNLTTSKLIQVNSDVVEKCKFLVKFKANLYEQNFSLRDKVNCIHEQVLQNLDSHFKTVLESLSENLQENVTKDLELYVKIPIFAMNRSWNSPFCVDYRRKNILVGLSLPYIILQSEEICLKYVLELRHWIEFLKDKLNFHTEKQLETISIKKSEHKKGSTSMTDKIEREISQLQSIIAFWKKQPLIRYIPDDLLIHGETYSTWKNKQEKC